MATYSVNLSAGKVNYTVAKYNYICRNEKYGENKSKKEELQYFSSGNMRVGQKTNLYYFGNLRIIMKKQIHLENLKLHFRKNYHWKKTFLW